MANERKELMVDMDDYSMAQAIMKHYRTFRVKKRSGGFRTISAPSDDLKFAQKQMLWELERRVKISPFAHGFVIGRNSVTGASPHVGKKLVINIDVKDFFPSCERDKVLECLARQIGIEDPLFKKVADWCFVPTTKIAQGMKVVWGLPQGAPTSPFLSNLLMMSIDWRVARYVLKHYDNSDYTRYADDLTISSDDENVRTVIKVITSYLNGIDMVMNDKKLRIMRPHRRQDVCGIVVNEKINLPRRYRKLLRAMKHQGNDSAIAQGHYSYHNAVYGIDYDFGRYKTKSIVDTWKVGRRLSGSTTN